MAATVLLAPSGSAHEGRPAAIARFDSPQRARRAIELIEAQGVDGDDLTIASAAPVRPDLDHEATDQIQVRRQGLWIAAGAFAGTVAGAIVGVVFAGTVVLAWPGGLDHELWAFGLGAAWFAAAGAVFGAFVTLSRRTGFSDSWNATFDGWSAPVWLAVFREVEPAMLERTGASEVVVHPDVEVHHPESPAAGTGDLSGGSAARR